MVFSNAFYFDISHKDMRCFIEDIPDVSFCPKEIKVFYVAYVAFCKAYKAFLQSV